MPAKEPKLAVYRQNQLVITSTKISRIHECIMQFFKNIFYNLSEKLGFLDRDPKKIETLQTGCNLYYLTKANVCNQQTNSPEQVIQLPIRKDVGTETLSMTQIINAERLRQENIRAQMCDGFCNKLLEAIKSRIPKSDARDKLIGEVISIVKG